eukprot:scaffold120876_cov27-Tisochrysis_lutea.AAC.1
MANHLLRVVVYIGGSPRSLLVIFNGLGSTLQPCKPSSYTWLVTLVCQDRLVFPMPWERA